MSHKQVQDYRSKQNNAFLQNKYVPASIKDQLNKQVQDYRSKQNTYYKNTKGTIKMCT